MFSHRGIIPNITFTKKKYCTKTKSSHFNKQHISSKKIFPEDFFAQPNTKEKDLFTNIKVVSERKNSKVIEHPKLLNPTSPKDKNQIFGINSIKEEKTEESMAYTEHNENGKNKKEIIDEKSNKLRNNKLDKIDKERDHSTSVSSNPQISYSKSNISANEILKNLDKNDNTPINDENIFQITPHFWNENTSNKHSIQLKLKYNNNKENNKNKKIKFSRPLTPNLNIIRKSSSTNMKKEGNKENKENKKTENGEDIKDIVDNNLNKRIIREINKTESNNNKKRAFSYTKNQILKNSKNVCTNKSYNENDNGNIQNNQIINYHNNNKYNKDQINISSNNKIPFSFNKNRSMLTKKKTSTSTKNSIQKKAKRKNSSMFSGRNSNNLINTSQQKKKYIRNFSRQKKTDVYGHNDLKPFKSENKIRVVHSKVNNEINNLFKGLSDNIAKDPEVNNKIETLIKDIKDIQKVVLRKTQSNFRPKKQNLVENNCNKDNI